MIEHATLREGLTQFGVATHVETWEAHGIFVFVVTNMESGERTVCVGDNADSWRELVAADPPGRFPIEPPADDDE